MTEDRDSTQLPAVHYTPGAKFKFPVSLIKEFREAAFESSEGRKRRDAGCTNTRIGATRSEQVNMDRIVTD